MRRLSFRWLEVVVVVSACSTGAAPARAEFVDPPFNTIFETTLAALLDDGADEGIRVGGNRYYDFTFSSTGDAAVAAEDVGVVVDYFGGSFTQHRIAFTFDRGVLEASGGRKTDVVIGYRVDLLGPPVFDTMGLAMTGTFGGADAAGSVATTVRAGDGSNLSVNGAPPAHEAVLGLFRDGPGDLPDSSRLVVPFTPVQSLVFENDILVSSRAGATGRADIQRVENFVGHVPEPSSAAVLGAAGTLLLARRRRA